MGDSWWAACALLLIFEGLLPFAAPGLWRRMWTQVAQLRDGQIRFFALCSIGAGLLLLLLLLWL